jgi:type IV pilus biogenesis protein PilP
MMRKLEKEQLPKVIAFGVLSAVLLGYTGYTWLGHGGGPAAPAAAATPHLAAPKPTAPPAPTAADKVLALPPINHDNPFQPTILANSAVAPPSSAAPKPPPPAAKPKGAQQLASLPETLNGPSMDSLPGLPPVVGGPGPVTAPASPSKPAVSAPSTPSAHAAARPAPAPPKPPAMVVTGILEGQENVAILKWSDTQRQVVRVGDRLDGGYVVKAIRADAVVLSLGNSTWVMRLGTAARA